MNLPAMPFPKSKPTMHPARVSGTLLQKQAAAPDRPKIEHMTAMSLTTFHPP
jgi:hypothetical protein